MPTVKQLLREVLPPATRVVAGEGGLFSEVSWVVTLRPSPPGFDGLKGSEFAVVGAGVAEGLGVTLSHLISTLAERKVSAVGIVGEVSAAVVRESQIRGMPLLQLPSQTNLTSLEAEILRLIGEERQYLYQKEREFTQSLMELAVAGGGSAAIMEKLRELTGRTIGFVDINLKPHFPLNKELAGAFRGEVQKALRRSGTTLSSTTSPIIGMNLTKEEACFLGPVKVGRENKGYLMLIAPEREISEIDRLAVRVGSLALAVEMSRRQAVEETEDRFEEDIVEVLISGEFSSQLVNERAKRLNLDLSTPFVAMLLKPTGSEPAVIVRQVESLLPKALSYVREDTLITLYPTESVLNAVELRQLGKKLAGGLARTVDKPVTLGVGRSYSGPEGIRLSFQEAEQALTMGSKLFGDGSVTNFADLGIYRLLFSLKSGAELKSFFDEYLGKLAEYDQKHEGELLHTLEAFLHCKTGAETARAIHVHRNTLLYRLERIKEITGFDIEDGETLLALHLALLAGEIIRVS